jgi:type VI secretion system secreted protein Hcp
MPTPAYLTIVGEKQGLISSGASTEGSIGNSWQRGREDQILVQAVSHGVSVKNGQTDGRRMHRPLTITKVLDKSSALIYAAMCSGEALKTCRLDWYRTASNGGLEHFYTMELEDAVFINAELIMPHCQDPVAQSYTQMERVQIAYRTVTWRHEICQTMAFDTWQGDDE